MATPHVTGVAALHLSTHRTATPAQVGAALTAYASTGSVIDPGPGSANRLLYAGGSPQRPPGRRFANTTDYPVADQATVDSPITVSGVSGTAPADLDVEIAVRHPDVGDLRIDVIAPDGTAYPVKDEWEAWIETDYTVVIAIDASSRTANGVWRLRVFDTRSGNTGYIDSWALRF